MGNFTNFGGLQRRNSLRLFGRRNELRLYGRIRQYFTKIIYSELCTNGYKIHGHVCIIPILQAGRGYSVFVVKQFII